MVFDPGDGLTDELAAQIRAELEADETGEEPRARAGVRPAEDGRVELVSFDDDGDAFDVVVSLTRDDAATLAAALLEAAGPQS